MTTEAIRLGTRGSQLARTQSQWVADRLFEATGRRVELVIIQTRGDQVTDRPLAAVGGKGLFTKEIEDALLAGTVDFAVHSMKDMPTDQPPGLVFGATPVREDARDVIVGGTLSQLAQGAVVGTGSARRAAQIAAVRPDLDIQGIRGNVDTRIAKQRRGDYDAVVLAAAGIARLGRSGEVDEFIDPAVVVPAVGQGALAVQCRAGDGRILELLAGIHHPSTQTCVDAERAFLVRLQGGCSVPAGAHAQLIGEDLIVRGFYASEGELRRHEVRGGMAHAVELGTELADALL